MTRYFYQCRLVTDQQTKPYNTSGTGFRTILFSSISKESIMLKSRLKLRNHLAWKTILFSQAKVTFWKQKYHKMGTIEKFAKIAKRSGFQFFALFSLMTWSKLLQKERLFKTLRKLNKQCYNTRAFTHAYIHKSCKTNKNVFQSLGRCIFQLPRLGPNYRANDPNMTNFKWELAKNFLY